MWQVYKHVYKQSYSFWTFSFGKKCFSATVQALNILAQVNIAKILNFTNDFRGDLWNLDDIWGWTLVNLQNTFELFGLFWYWRTYHSLSWQYHISSPQPSPESPLSFPWRITLWLAWKMERTYHTVHAVLFWQLRFSNLDFTTATWPHTLASWIQSK